MANLYTGELSFDGYQTVSSLTGIAFTEGTTYTIQIQNGAYVREGTTGEGFLWDEIKPFQYTATDEDLYIKQSNENPYIIINIGD